MHTSSSSLYIHVGLLFRPVSSLLFHPTRLLSTLGKCYIRTHTHAHIYIGNLDSLIDNTAKAMTGMPAKIFHKPTLLLTFPPLSLFPLPDHISHASPPSPSPPKKSLFAPLDPSNCVRLLQVQHPQPSLQTLLMPLRLSSSSSIFSRISFIL